MKNIIKLINLIFISINCALYINAQNNHLLYSFPNDWNKIESVYGKNKLLQIPDSINRKISTDGLVDLCLIYPYFLDVLFCDDLQKGFDNVRKNFNGLEELMKRNNVSKILFNLFGLNSPPLAAKF